MIQKLVLASNNKGKLAELSPMLAPLGFELVTQGELGIAEAEEPFHTFLENALTKARHASRASGLPVVWRSTGGGFVFEGLPAPALPQHWLSPTTHAAPGQTVLLGPEPLIPRQSIALSPMDTPTRRLWVSTDGLRPFQVQNQPALP